MNPDPIDPIHENDERQIILTFSGGKRCLPGKKWTN
jgi:hypothetical protein